MKPIWASEFSTAWKKLMAPSLKRKTKKKRVIGPATAGCLSACTGPGSVSSFTHTHTMYFEPPGTKSHVLGPADHCSFLFRVKSAFPISFRVLIYLLIKQTET